METQMLRLRCVRPPPPRIRMIVTIPIRTSIPESRTTATASTTIATVFLMRITIRQKMMMGTATPKMRETATTQIRLSILGQLITTATTSTTIATVLLMKTAVIATRCGGSTRRTTPQWWWQTILPSWILAAMTKVPPSVVTSTSSTTETDSLPQEAARACSFRMVGCILRECCKMVRRSGCTVGLWRPRTSIWRSLQNSPSRVRM